MAYTTIDNPELYFQTKLWSGASGGGDQTITLDGSENMQPDWVWIKHRNGTGHHVFTDSVRGATKELRANATDDESTAAEGLQAFQTDGYLLGDNNGDYNRDTRTYVGWNWKAGTSFTNDASSTGIGTIDSTGSANDTAGFSIVSYTGNGTSGATVKHGLSSALGMLIVKSRSEARNWGVFHQSNGGTKNLSLDTTDAVEVNAARWNNTAPTSSVFTLGNSTPVNNNGITYVAYCFAEKQGYSKFGSYTGNGNADGTFVYTGFRPAFVIIKPSSYSNSWLILDNKRNTFNPTNTRLEADGTGADYSGLDYTDFLSNGFKIRTSNSHPNNSGGTLIYMAFAESPFTNSSGVPNNAR